MLVFWIIWLLWLTSEVLLNRLMRSDPEDRSGQDKGSMLFIWLMIAVTVFAGIMIAINTRFPVSRHAIISYAGLALIIAGMVVRFLSVRVLGRFFTVDVTIRQGHKLKTDGIYGFVRHPSYSGSLLSFLGFGLSLNNWLSLAVIIILVSIAFVYRIRIEEKLLTEQFGAEYRNYKRKTYCLIPWIY